MNMRFIIKIGLFLPLLVLLSGCGIKQKKLLNKLSIGMTKVEVKSKMGEPDEIHAPIKDNDGNVVDIWEYNLAAIDENQVVKQFSVSFPLALLGLSLQFIPGFPLAVALMFSCSSFIPAAVMESPYHYETYLIKFVNDILAHWGKKVGDSSIN